VDLNTITEFRLARSRADLSDVGGGVAVMGGGTWLFSEPQDHLERLVDLTTLNWPALTVRTTGAAAGLEIAATCTVKELSEFGLPSQWPAQPLLRECCQAFLASYKIWNFATVGGNICLSFPAGPMTSLVAALDGECLIWRADGSEYRLPITEFVTGNSTNVLQPGDVLRSLHIPATALAGRTGYRQIALSPLGRSGALVIGRLTGSGFVLTISAATVRPVVLRFDAVPSAVELADEVAAVDPALWHRDAHGTPDWRRAVSVVLGEQIRAELGGAG
jgi:CO/xanthine dehydrogenase FAD-binding subunit